MIESVTVRVPATSANLGPGFDCLGLALDLWNETIFSLEGMGTTVVVTGEGAGILPTDQSNLIAQSAFSVFQRFNYNPTPGLLIRCFNRIPLSSGLGSSAAALVTGVLGANALLGNPLSEREVLELLTQIEGHGDNVAPAVLGGMVMVSGAGPDVRYRKIWDGMIGGNQLQTVVVLPEVTISTLEARALLPQVIPLADAVFNIQHTAMVIDAFTTGDLELLGYAMQDRLHQPYRLDKIPGAEEALRAGREAGAAATALSGAGPSVIAFGLEDMQQIGEAMQNEFSNHQLDSKLYLLSVTEEGANISYEATDD